MHSPADPYHNQEHAEKSVTVNVKDDDGSDLKENRGKRFFCWFLTKKQWIYALVGTILGVLLVLFLILWFAVIPAVFQSKIDNVELSLSHFDLLKMSSDPTDKNVGVDLSIHVKHDGSVNAVMDAAEIPLLYGGKRFGTVKLPAQDIRKDNKEYDIVIKDTAEIEDLEVFYKLSTDVVVKETITIDADAKVDVHAFGLSQSGLSLKRKFEVKALANFNDPISVINKMTPGDCPNNQFKVTINVTLDNDSQIGLNGLGILNVSVFHDANYLGYAVLQDEARVGLPRGPTPMVYELTVANTTEQLVVFGKMFKAVIGSSKTKPVQFWISGDNGDFVSKDAAILTTSLHSLNMSLPYTDGLAKIDIATGAANLAKCGLTSLLAG